MVNFVAEGIYAELPVAANALIEMGDLVQIVSGGLASPMTQAANLVFVGVAATSADNRGGAAGDKTVRVLRRGTVEIDTATTFTQSNVGQLCYAENKSSVHTTATGRTAVGRVISIVGNRVRIDFSKATI